MTATPDHLRFQIEVSESARDRLRDELGSYGCGVVMLDGVRRDQHDSVVTNAKYSLNIHTKESYPIQDETLFELEGATA